MAKVNEVKQPSTRPPKHFTYGRIKSKFTITFLFTHHALFCKHSRSSSIVVPALKVYSHSSLLTDSMRGGAIRLELRAPLTNARAHPMMSKNTTPATTDMMIKPIVPEKKLSNEKPATGLM